MHVKSLSVFFLMLLVATSCGGGSSEQAQPTTALDSTNPPISAPDLETTPETIKETVPFCEAEVPTEGASIEDLRSGLAAFREVDADPTTVANEFTLFPEIPTSPEATFVGYTTTMTDKGDGNVSFGTSLAYRESDPLETVTDRYKAYADEKGWSFESDEVTPTLIVMELTAPEDDEEIKVTFTPSGTGKPTAGLDIRYTASGETSALGDPSVWHQWHTEELPYVEGACYRGGGASTNIPHPDSSTTFGGPGDNITVDLAYPDMTQDVFAEEMMANAETAGFVVEPGNLDGFYKLSKADYVIEYRVSPAASIEGILVTASANYQNV